MAVKIRLTRLGRKNRPFYRINVADTRSPRDGRFIESIGIYNPIADKLEIRVDEERANYWLDKGAQPSHTVRNLFQSKGILLKRSLIKRGFDEKAIEEEMKKWEVLQLERQHRHEALKEQLKVVKSKAKKEEPGIEEKVETQDDEKPELSGIDKPEVEETVEPELKEPEEPETKEAVGPEVKESEITASEPDKDEANASPEPEETTKEEAQ